MISETDAVHGRGSGLFLRGRHGRRREKTGLIAGGSTNGVVVGAVVLACNIRRGGFWLVGKPKSPAIITRLGLGQHSKGGKTRSTTESRRKEKSCGVAGDDSAVKRVALFGGGGGWVL